MDNLSSKKDIQNISLDILKQSKALDVFPTPVDKIVNFSDLVFEGSVNLSDVDESFLSKVSSSFLSAWNKVRGFLDRKEKVIYLDLNQIESRQNFVKLHEVGHQVLPWQSQIIQYMDTDESLSPHVAEEFEAEANYFASLTLFQHDRFNSELGKLDLSLKSGMALAKIFGGSIHASLRRMVQESKKRCGLLVIERRSGIAKNKPSYAKRNLFLSDSFHECFGHLVLPDMFGFEWAFVQDCIFKKRYKDNGEMCLLTTQGDVEFTYHFFDNSYNAFVFFFPKGEVQKARRQVIITRHN